jgi:two-component system cell cycle response regulator DivK
MPLLALVADDDPASIELLRYLLERDGFEVVSAADGAEALSLAAARRPHVIVLDLDLSVVNGCQVRDRLAADAELSAIPVVVVSTYEIGEFCPGRTAADFAGYVRKPLDPTVLARQISAAIGKSGSH